MKKAVFKLEVNDGSRCLFICLSRSVNSRERHLGVIKKVSGLQGVVSVAMDMMDKKLTVIGDIDPVSIVSMLRRKQCYTEIVSVGPPKEPGKKNDRKDKVE